MEIITTLLWLSINLYHEGRGEPDIGKKAIAHVVLNRAMAKRMTIKEVILEPKQFSWVGHADMAYTEISAYQNCEKAAKEALSEADFTGGALYYHNKTVKPYWTKNVEYVGTYGSHLFYKSKLPLLWPTSIKIRIKN
jgi:N-acetylmuramoyl-L-alanine amidase